MEDRGSYVENRRYLGLGEEMEDEFYAPFPGSSLSSIIDHPSSHFSPSPRPQSPRRAYVT
jgi:hypothetical protein